MFRAIWIRLVSSAPTKRPSALARARRRPEVERLEERALLSGGLSTSGHSHDDPAAGTAGTVQASGSTIVVDSQNGYPVPPTTMPMPTGTVGVQPTPSLVLPTLNGSPGGSATTSLAGTVTAPQGTSGGPGPTLTVTQPTGSSGGSGSTTTATQPTGSSGGPSQPTTLALAPLSGSH
ncbi:MAG TPA: hypothetical protein VJ739_07560 [Gemmataceae bacterium]|nr:hypothetical protein [Gemmataceae bacterium]